MSDSNDDRRVGRYFVHTRDAQRLAFHPEDPTGERLAIETFALVGHRDGRPHEIVGATRTSACAGQDAAKMQAAGPWEEVYVAPIRRRDCDDDDQIVTVLTTAGAYVTHGSPPAVFTAAANAGEVVCDTDDADTVLGERYGAEFVLRPCNHHFVGILYEHALGDGPSPPVGLDGDMPVIRLTIDAAVAEETLCDLSAGPMHTGAILGLLSDASPGIAVVDRRRVR